MEEKTETQKEVDNVEPTDLEANQASDMVSNAHEAAARLEKANRELARLLQKEESLKVERALQGQASASEPVKQEESDKDYARRVMNNGI